jgi:Tfp pilus assembly protein PilF
MSGHLDEAWRVARETKAETSLSEPLMLGLTQSQFERGDRRAALATLQQYFDVHPSAHGAWVLASFHYRLGEEEQARRSLEESLKIDPKFTPARIDLGIWLSQNGDDEAAEREFLQAIQDGPYYARAFYNYGTFLLKDGRYSEAAAYFRRAIALAPRYLQAHAALVAAYVADGQQDQAEEALGALRKLAPSSPEVAMAEKMLSSS